ncbi:DUF1604-domain-containing protein [Amniculicola lignicola CBS 123094]|uniref:DUF1604-domain-containing protein n=1 Tax=Amniculicola lignicola CBS 123094 TaxID=1392246 RepID=A0A6A5VXX0_9PLEO|nr:DUF1604-domain-containing protein [Amniculicola lignicola CBS 123094]
MASRPSAPYKRRRAASPHVAQKRTRMGEELPHDDETKPAWKQTAEDEQGRRRFHGAFTGGFSAGHFNTVGSKEGWTPQTFVSSRTNRATVTHRAEDYMDDEDRAEAEQTQHLETMGGGVAGDGARDGIAVDGDTGGVLVAQKMEWRRGQGAGRKVRRGARFEPVGADGVVEMHLFAPEDIPLRRYAPRDKGRKGLGFEPEARLDEEGNEDQEHPSPMAVVPLVRFKKPKKKSAFKRTGFGTGVLDNGSDDEDPYSLGPKITINYALGKDKKKKKPTKIIRPQKKRGLVSNASARRPSTSLVGFMCRGRIVHRSRKGSYAVPKAAPDWKPSNAIAISQPQSFQSVPEAARASNLDPSARARMLGEMPLRSNSVFNYISKEARDRIAAATGRPDLPPGLGLRPPKDGVPASDAVTPKVEQSEEQRTEETLIPALGANSAKQALTYIGTPFMPFGDDSYKRVRYLDFLRYRAGLKEPPKRDSNMSVSIWTSELQEFVQVATATPSSDGKVTGSISASLAARFTQSANRFVSAGVLQPGQSKTLPPALFPKQEDPAEQAAQMGMFGALTRSEFAFHPSRLLCKRFGV